MQSGSPARAEDLSPIPETIDDATAGGHTVAYLTAQITLTQAGFVPGKTVWRRRSVARSAMLPPSWPARRGAAKAISTTADR